MQEQTENTNVETSQESTNEPSYSDIELKAIEQGWIPKAEFDGDEVEFIDAPEFVRRGELFRKIETQSREIKQVRQALEAMRVHNTKIKEAEYKNALKTLQEARKQAVIDGEHEKAFVLEEKIDEIKVEREQLNDLPVIEDTSYTPEFQRWVDQNPWYETNETMRATADVIGVKLAKQGFNPQEVLQKVEQEIKREFSHKFKREVSNKPNAVEAPSRANSKSNDLVMTPDELSIMRKIVSTGVMTEAEYKKQLKATR
jgi:hypothetical protein